MIFKFGRKDQKTAYQLFFNNELFQKSDSDFVMKSNTSYIEKFIKRYSTSKNYREALLPLKLQCLLNIKDVIGGRYNTYFDLLAGIGISGRIFNEKVNHLNDFCPTCEKILEENFPIDFVTKRDMRQCWTNTVYDFIFADFNNFTVKRYINEYKPVINNVFYLADKYVLINDCSVFFLKYGVKSYEIYSKLLGTQIHTINDYYLAVKDYFKRQYPDWSLVIVEAFKDTSFLLFVKDQEDGLQVTINTKEHLNIKTELIND